MNDFMTKAILEAEKALLSDDIPVGCVITENGVVISKAHNSVQKDGNVCNHAEILAINSAISQKKEKDLRNCEMYVTLEPCPMCAGAIIASKIKRVYIGTPEPKSGCFGSKMNFAASGFNHSPEIYMGIGEDECKKLLVEFFKNKR